MLHKFLVIMVIFSANNINPVFHPSMIISIASYRSASLKHESLIHEFGYSMIVFWTPFFPEASIFHFSQKMKKHRMLSIKNLSYSLNMVEICVNTVVINTINIPILIKLLSKH